ncbi:MAG: lysylphosphatidylglycerol synthase domain-containing protein [Anaerolineae bacterium]
MKLALRWPRLKLIAQALFYLLCAVYLLRWFRFNGAAVQAIWFEIDWQAALGSLLLLAGSFLFLPGAMVLFMRAGGNRLSYAQSARAYYGSQPAKYLPGGVWVFPSRLVLMREMGFDLGVSSMALGFEMMTLIVSSLLVSLITLGGAVGQVWQAAFQIFIVVACLGVVAVYILLPELWQLVRARLSGPPFRRMSVGGRNSYRSRPDSSAGELPPALQAIKPIPLPARLKLILASVAMYGAMWLLAGFSFYLLFNSVSEMGGLDKVPLAIGVFAFAWLAGFISVFSPGGIGVREGVIHLLLSPFVATPYPIAIALFSRVLWSLLEAIFFLIVLLIGRRSS